MQLQSSEKCFKISFNTKLGRHLIATRDIAVGEVIIDDAPLVLGPSTFIDPNKISSIPDTVCPACYIKLPEENDGIDNDENEGRRFQCPKCRLNLCSKECSEKVIHVENECKIFHQIPDLHTALESVKDLHQFITTIRCLFYRRNDPIKWQQVRELQGRVEDLQKLGVYDGMEKAFTLLKWEHFDNDSGELEQPEESIPDIGYMARHCLGILRTNAFSRFSSKVSIECLYFLSSFMAHNCLMNTDRSFDMDGVRLVTRAAKPIPKGHLINTTYLSHLSNNVERQKEMKSVWNFSCDCERCLDPTECETYLSTILCPSCHQCTLHPHVNPQTFNHTWICGNQNCKYILRLEETRSHLESTIWTVENDQPDITDLQATEEWLELYDNGKFVHSNNSVFLHVKLYLCQEYGSRGGISHLSDIDLGRKVTLCSEVLMVLDKILDGAYMLRGVVLFELWLSLMETRNRTRSAQDISDNPLTLQRLTEENEQIRQISIMAKEILRYGASNSAEEYMFRILQDNENECESQEQSS